MSSRCVTAPAVSAPSSAVFSAARLLEMVAVEPPKPTIVNLAAIRRESPLVNPSPGAKARLCLWLCCTGHRDINAAGLNLLVAIAGADRHGSHDCAEKRERCANKK